MRERLRALRRYELCRHGTLYMMFLPATALVLLVTYLPLFGLILAFKDFSFKLGIFASPWMKPFLGNFQYLFSTSSAWVATRNTILLNLLFITCETVFAVALALIFNEIRSQRFKKGAQFSIFLPYFVSWIVVGLFAYNLFNYENGMINSLLAVMGRERVNWYGEAGRWPWIMLFFRLWKGAGYNMILYIAALAGVDVTLYEAAQLDGANKWQQIRYVSLPMLAPTIMTLVLLSAGRIMNADFGMFFSLVGNNAQLYGTVDVLDTFVYRNLRLNGDIGMSSAAAFYQSILSCVILVSINRLARRVNPEGALF